MCDECGCEGGDRLPAQPRSPNSGSRLNPDNGDNTTVKIEIKRDIYKENDSIAEHNKEKFLKDNISVFNIMGSVGSGKTTLIKRLCRGLKDKYRIKVIAGDIATDIDAKRISEEGVPVKQINTGGMCHLDANIVHKTLHEIGTDNTDIIFIENVGNLICPASFYLGETKKLVVVSVTEGPYMAVKHPIMFRGVDYVIINKTDLADAMEVSPDAIEEQIKKIEPKAKVLKASLKDDGSFEGLLEAIRF